MLWLLLNSRFFERMDAFILSRFLLLYWLWMLRFIDHEVIECIIFLWNLRLLKLWSLLLLHIFFFAMLLLFTWVVPSFSKRWLLIRLRVVGWLIGNNAFFILLLNILHYRDLWLVMQHFLKILRTFTFKDFDVLLLLEEMRILQCLENGFKLFLLRSWWWVPKVNTTCIAVHTEVNLSISCWRLGCPSL
jgi:hypothetical protein